MGNFDEKRIQELVTDMETWNPIDRRKAAVIELRRLAIPHVSVVTALQRHIKEYHHQLQDIMVDTLDTLLMRNKIKPAPKVVQTSIVVDIKEVCTNGELNEESGTPYCRCNFCHKEEIVTPRMTANNVKMAGPHRFFCNFCLRNKYNTKGNKNILVTTFRGLIGYYYYAFYALPKTPILYLNELNDFIELHAEIGSSNPVFNYDKTSFLWFLDFSRIGKGRGMMPIEDVLFTIGEILMGFSMFDYIKDIKPHLLYKKYEEAIQTFYHQRQRPDNNKILSPTLIKTGAGDSAPEKPHVFTLNTSYGGSTGTGYNDGKRKVNFDDTKVFNPMMIVERR